MPATMTAAAAAQRHVPVGIIESPMIQLILLTRVRGDAEKSGDSRCVTASLRASASLRLRDTGIPRVTNDSCPRAGSNHRALSLPERLLDAALEAIEHRLPMTLR